MSTIHLPSHNQSSIFPQTKNCSLRTSLVAHRLHAEDNDVKAISVPKLACGIDQLERHLVRKILQDELATSEIRLTVYMLDSAELEETSNNSVTDYGDPSFTKKIRSAQDKDESLKLDKDWVRQSRVLKNNDFQGIPHLTWQLYKKLEVFFFIGRRTLS